MGDNLQPSSISRGPTPAQWEAQKPKIWTLYREQNLTHRDLASEMSKIFGCRITAKMCKDRTTKWDFGKSIKKREYETIIEQQAKHDHQQKPIWIRGREVKQRDLNRYLKRRKLDASPPRRQRCSDLGFDHCSRDSGKDEDNLPRQSPGLESGCIRQQRPELVDA